MPLWLTFCQGHHCVGNHGYANAARDWPCKLLQCAYQDQLAILWARQISCVWPACMQLSGHHGGAAQHLQVLCIFTIDQRTIQVAFRRPAGVLVSLAHVTPRQSALLVPPWPFFLQQLDIPCRCDLPGCFRGQADKTLVYQVCSRVMEDEALVHVRHCALHRSSRLRNAHVKCLSCICRTGRPGDSVKLAARSHGVIHRHAA